MKKYKIVSIISLLIVTLVFGTFTGCKPNSAPKNTKKSVIPSNKLDLKGREIRFTSYQYGEMYENGAKMINCVYDKKSPDYKYYSKQVKDIEANYNCSLIWAISTHESLLNSVMKGEPAADLSDFNQKEIIQNLSLGEQSLIMPLDNYADILEINNPELWDQNAMEFYRFGGNTLVLCPPEIWTDADNCTAMFFNKKILVDKGLWDGYNLYEMQMNKTWTWDIFKDLCQKVTRDSDGDGKIDKFGIDFNDFYMLEPLALSNGNGVNESALIKFDDGNNAVLAINQPEQRAAYDLLRGLNDSGCIHYFNESGSMFDPFLNGNILFTIGSGRMADNLNKGKNVELGVVGIPLGPNNKDKGYYTQKSLGINTTGMFKNVKNPSELINVLKDYAATPIPPEEADMFESEYLTNTLGFDNSMLETLDIITQPDVACYAYWELWRELQDYKTKISDSFTKNYSTEKLFGSDLIETQNSITEYWDKVKVGIAENKKS